MARRDVEPAARLRLSESLDAVISRRGVLLVRGDRVFRLDDRETRKLASELAGHVLVPAPGQTASRLMSAAAED